MRTHAPCGACAALVPADTGCPHWKPQGAMARAARIREARKMKAEDRDRLVEEFRAMITR